ncbi:hypothetical protein GCM10023322_38170 [Rugosimonospora acidiphila]|uniref:Uncharacterized protein n=1 Tax=Rugosimonospora acidiphila TaxID=556531 RepID=A0ABP9RVT0_9ACTN
MGIGDGDNGSSGSPTGAGSAETFRVEFTPTSRDKKFGTFQLYLGGSPIGDGSTTALYPHYQNFCRLYILAKQPGPQQRRRPHLDDTLDHLDIYVEMTKLDVVFTLTTRAEWGRSAAMGATGRHVAPTERSPVRIHQHLGPGRAAIPISPGTAVAGAPPRDGCRPQETPPIASTVGHASRASGPVTGAARRHERALTHPP